MSRATTTTYDDQIVSLLRQMSQLEKLTLSLEIGNRRTYVEGTHLNNEILSQMSYLRTFIFDIVTHIVDSNEILKSNDDVRRIFVQHVDGYIDYFPNKEGRCHLFSLPFTMKYMHAVTNNFPGGIFRKVRMSSIFDDIRSFEYDFFK
ncbi:unnamed protein product [Rotaria sp. Silwood1]|nr:unnamed protein product [Rotaria sp. Silwood1]CAF4742274.1 unnamed protein product [Rotaria sp. Silwood1]CAF4915928.1 unnamed protein product [Rotaria sp. Silwood1]